MHFFSVARSMSCEIICVSTWPHFIFGFHFYFFFSLFFNVFGSHFETFQMINKNFDPKIIHCTLCCTENACGNHQNCWPEISSLHFARCACPTKKEIRLNYFYLFFFVFFSFCFCFISSNFTPNSTMNKTNRSLLKAKAWFENALNNFTFKLKMNGNALTSCTLWIVIIVKASHSQEKKKK